MAFGVFHALFSMEDQASNKLLTLAGAAQTVVGATAAMRDILIDLSTRLNRMASTAGETQEEVGNLGLRILNMANTGSFSSAALLNLAKHTEMLGQRIPELSNEMRILSADLIDLSARMRQVEQAAASAGKRGFAFLGDVSDKAVIGMRRVSAAAQGAMLGMSLLQRNVIGLAFSLIFLQFSGFLKTSLFVAGLTVALGAAAFAFTSLLREGNRIRSVSTMIRILTRNMQGFELAQEQARIVSERFGGGLTRDIQNAIAAFVDARIPITENMLEQFAQLLIMFKLESLGAVESVDDLIAKFIEFGEKGFVGDRVLSELNRTQEDVDQTLIEWRDSQERRGAEIREKFLDALQPTAESTTSFWSAFKEDFFVGLTGFLDIFASRFKEGLEKLFKIAFQPEFGFDKAPESIIKWMNNLGLAISGLIKEALKAGKDLLIAFFKFGWLFGGDDSEGGSTTPLLLINPFDWINDSWITTSGNILRSIPKWIRDFGIEIGGISVSWAENVVSPIKKVWNLSVDTILRIGGRIVSFFSNDIPNAANVVLEKFGFIKNIVEDIKGGIISFRNTAVFAFKTVQTFIEDLFNPFEVMFDWIVRIVNKIIELIDLLPFVEIGEQRASGRASGNTSINVDMSHSSFRNRQDVESAGGIVASKILTNLERRGGLTFAPLQPSGP